ncbi:phosphotransferase family protein [Sphingobium sp. AN558]|uniref:phosphotransferase family protein n=1 Tax=Sphingobium sp. AN558 TaxID=3133442 RepID=UPI0030C3672B
MIPGDLSILRAIRRAVDDLTAVTSGEQRAMLGAIDVSLNELLLRQDRSFYLDYYRKGFELVNDGIRLGLGPTSVLADCPPELGADLANDAVGLHTERVTGILETFTAAAQEIGPAKFKAYLDNITFWEIELFQHRQRSERSVVGTAPLNFTKAALISYLQQRFPDAGPVEVTTFTRIFGGYSKLTIMFSTDVELSGGTEFVIRAEQASIIPHAGGSSENEFAVMRYAYEHGIRIPEPLWVELDAGKMGARFVVSRRARGAVFGTTIGASSRLEEGALRDLVRELVKIHSVEVDGANSWVRKSHLAKWASFPNLRENVLFKFDYWKDIIARSPHSHSPLIERCAGWLQQNVPETDDRPSLVHGDYGLHNILIEKGAVTAVLDWEVTHFGDRAQDLIYFIICLTGAATPEEILEMYVEEGGMPVSQERLRFYDVYYSYNILIVCNIALARLNAGAENLLLAELGLKAMHFYAERARNVMI